MGTRLPLLGGVIGDWRNIAITPTTFRPDLPAQLTRAKPAPAQTLDLVAFDIAESRA